MHRRVNSCTNISCHIQPVCDDNTRDKRGRKRLYLRCIVANRRMRSPTGSHSKSHDLPFDKDEQQHKHLRTQTKHNRTGARDELSLNRLFTAGNPSCNAVSYQTPIGHHQNNINS